MQTEDRREISSKAKYYGESDREKVQLWRDEKNFENRVKRARNCMRGTVSGDTRDGIRSNLLMWVIACALFLWSSFASCLTTVGLRGLFVIACILAVCLSWGCAMGCRRGVCRLGRLGYGLFSSQRRSHLMKAIHLALDSLCVENGRLVARCVVSVSVISKHLPVDWWKCVLAVGFLPFLG